MPKSYPDKKNSGQVLVVTSLVVVLLLMSTIVYVAETQKNTPVYHPDANTDFAAVKQAAMHTAISALANISNGGNPSVLTDDLTIFKSAVTGLSYSAIVDFDVITSDTAPYVNGVWFDWETIGEGFSSVLMELTLNSSGNSANYYTQYSVNVTSSIKVNSIYIPINEIQKQVTVYCTLLNEGKPAAAESIEVFYRQDTPNSWVQATSPTIINYGNGTYKVTFITQNATQTDLPISVHCQDNRAITVWTNTTSTQG